jgi:superfamily II DNA or RNA helicase
MNFKPTKEQERIFLFTKRRPENLLIKARAGTGKTTTAIECAKLLPKEKNITFLAFNKHIQEELKTKLPEHLRCYTTYGLGLGALKRKYGDSIQFDEFKMDKIILKKSKSWKLDVEGAL